MSKNSCQNKLGQFNDLLRKLKYEINFRSFYQSFLQKIREYADGRKATALCPFHEDHNPSLSINLQNGLFYCFACGAKGDVITFYMKLKRLNFKTAINELAEAYGII